MAAQRKLNPVETLRDELQAIRKRIADTKAQLRAVEAAPANKSEQVAALSSWVDRRAATYAERLRDQLEGMGKAPTEPVLIPIPHVAGTASDQTEAIVGLLCLVAGDLMKKRLAELLPAGGYSNEDRAQQLAGLDERQLALEIDEENLITVAEGYGIELLRRPDADPRAILVETTE